MIGIHELRDVFLDFDRPGESLLNQTSLFLVLWSINPQTLQYNWAIWAGFMLLWLVLVLFLTRGNAIAKFFQKSLWIIAVFPVWNLVMDLLGKGTLRDRQISIALTLIIPWYFILYGRKREMALIARIALAYLSFVALTTLVQYLTVPDISRSLAGIERGVFLSSPLLANYHVIYETVPLLIILLWGLIEYPKGAKGLWGGLFLIQLLLVAFAGYHIARITTLVVLTLTLAYAINCRAEGKRGLRVSEPSSLAGEHAPGTGLKHPGAVLKHPGAVLKHQFLLVLGAAAFYTIPAIVILFAEGFMDRVFLNLDLRIMDFWARLVSRLRVYLESVVLFQKYPLLGVSGQRDSWRYELGNHSDYFDTLAEYGLIGFLIFIVTAFLMYWLMIRELSGRHRVVYLMALLSFHIIFLVNPVYDVSSGVMLFFIIPGLLFYFDAGKPKRTGP